MAGVGSFAQDGDNLIHVFAMTAHRNLQSVVFNVWSLRAVFFWSPSIPGAGTVDSQVS